MITAVENRMVRSEDLNDRQLVTVTEAAQLYRVHPRTIRAWIRKGAIPHIRIGPPPGRIRLRRSDLETR